MSKGLTYDSLTHFCRIGRTVARPGPRPTYAITLAPEQEARLQQLSTCYRAPFATVQRAQIGLLAHQHPHWRTAVIAQRLGCSVNTGKRGRQRWQTTDSLHAAPRAGARRTCTQLQRAQVVASACRAPRQYGTPWLRGSGEKLAQGAGEQQIVERISPGTVRRGLRADKSKPWRSHSWQHSTDPQFVEKAPSGLDLYAQTQPWQAHGELTGCTDEKTSIRRVSGARRPKPRCRARSCRWRIAINAGAHRNSSVPWLWLAV